MTRPAQQCPRCGSALSPDAAGGLCPTCLLEGALAEPESPEAEPTDVDGAVLEAAGFAPVATAAATDRFGDYRLEQEIGRGGMGIIYRAHQLSLNREVALKMILAGPLNSADFARRLRVEAEAAARLDHPHIVPIYEVGEHDGQPFYTMRLVEGTNLATALKAGPFDPRTAATVLATVAHAVQHAHERGVLHRDLKPSNILLDAAGQPHVGDFGLAKFVQGDSSLTLSQAALGTPSYMAPEQASGGSKTVTTAADVYSLGAILYELLTGQPLFKAETPLEAIRNVLEREPERPSRVNPRVPHDLETICLKCLQKEPRRRYPSAAAFAEDLERWIESKPIRARPVGWFERGWLWCRRKPALAALVGGLLLTLVAASAVSAWRITLARRQQRLEAYYAAVALADKFIKDNSPDRAMELLLQCPEELRHWEWGYLVAQCHQEIVTIDAHPAARVLFRWHVRSLDFDASGERLITLGMDDQLKVWDAWSGRELFRMGDTNQPITRFAVHPRRPEFVYSRKDGTLGRLDLQGARELPAPAVPADMGPISTLAFSTDGTTLLIATATCRVTLWDDARQEPRWNVSVPRTTAEQTVLGMYVTNLQWPFDATEYPRVSFTTDGRRVIVQGTISAVWLAVESGAVLQTREFDPLEYLALWVSPDGNCQVALRTTGEMVLGRGTDTVQRLARPITDTPLHERCVVFSPEGRRVFLGDEDGGARVFSLPDGNEVMAVPGRVRAAAFSPDGGRLAAFGAERTVLVRDLERRRQFFTLRGHVMPVSGAAFTKDGWRLATADWVGNVRIWSAQLGRSAMPTESYPRPHEASPDGRWVAGSQSRGELHLWDAESGTEACRLPTRWTPYYPAFSPDSRWLATASQDPLGRLWEVAPPRFVGFLRGATSTLRWVQFLPHGKAVVGLDSDGIVRAWDVPSCTARGAIPTGLRHPLSLWPSASSDFVVATDLTVPPVLVDLRSGRCTPFPREMGPAYMATFSPDDRYLVVSGLDGVLRILDPASLRVMATRQSRGFGTCARGFTPDGWRLAVAASDTFVSGRETSLVQIWDTTQWRELIAFASGEDPMDMPRFVGSGGRRLFSLGGEGTIRQWEAFPWHALDYAGQPGQTLAERIRAYATEYWRERLAQEQAGAARAATGTNATPFVDDLDLPGRDPRCRPEQLDLAPWFTGRLDGWLYPSANDWGADFSLAALPRGFVTFLGVPFDVRGVLVLRHFERSAGSRYQLYWARHPLRVAGIPVQQKARRLHALQSAIPSEAVADGTAIGSYVWHYADGTTHEEPIVYARDLRHWWLLADEQALDLERGRLVWVGDTPLAREAGARVRLYLTTYDNPRPEVEVSHLDFTSRMLPCAPFVVALTVER